MVILYHSRGYDGNMYYNNNNVSFCDIKISEETELVIIMLLVQVIHG